MLVSVRVFALYVCTMPFQTHFEKWLVFIQEITKKNIKFINAPIFLYHVIPSKNAFTKTMRLKVYNYEDHKNPY